MSPTMTSDVRLCPISGFPRSVAGRLNKQGITDLSQFARVEDLRHLFASVYRIRSRRAWIFFQKQWRDARLLMTVVDYDALVTQDSAGIQHVNSDKQVQTHPFSCPVNCSPINWTSLLFER
eukprot:c17764_g1_i1.p1 GENE.c17764_g1_i1~~c17764_g1_i1.p1  ORF type:complete len:139 (-),score=21.91 c17764_g1_i1:161-523(-)